MSLCLFEECFCLDLVRSGQVCAMGFCVMSFEKKILKSGRKASKQASKEMEG